MIGRLRKLGRKLHSLGLEMSFEIEDMTADEYRDLGRRMQEIEDELRQLREDYSPW